MSPPSLEEYAAQATSLGELMFDPSTDWAAKLAHYRTLATLAERVAFFQKLPGAGNLHASHLIATQQHASPAAAAAIEELRALNSAILNAIPRDAPGTDAQIAYQTPASFRHYHEFLVSNSQFLTRGHWEDIERTTRVHDGAKLVVFLHNLYGKKGFIIEQHLSVVVVPNDERDGERRAYEVLYNPMTLAPNPDPEFMNHVLGVPPRDMSKKEKSGATRPNNGEKTTSGEENNENVDGKAAEKKDNGQCGDSNGFDFNSDPDEPDLPPYYELRNTVGAFESITGARPWSGIFGRETILTVNPLTKNHVVSYWLHKVYYIQGWTPETQGVMVHDLSPERHLHLARMLKLVETARDAGYVVSQGAHNALACCLNAAFRVAYDNDGAPGNGRPSSEAFTDLPASGMITATARQAEEWYYTDRKGLNPHEFLDDPSLTTDDAATGFKKMGLDEFLQKQYDTLARPTMITAPKGQVSYYSRYDALGSTHPDPAMRELLAEGFKTQVELLKVRLGEVAGA